MAPSLLVAVSIFLASLLAVPLAPQPEREFEIAVAGRIELARLVELAAQRLQLSVEYDPSALAGQVTLRIDGSLSDAELWELTNRVLASRGLTTVRVAGRRALSVVKLADAAGLAPLADADEPAALPAPPGYASVLVRARHRPARELAEAARPVLSKPGGSAVPIGEGGLLLLSDLSPRLDQALALVERLDRPGQRTVVDEVPLEHLHAQTVATNLAQLLAKRELVSGSKLPGEALPAPGGRSLILVAPEERLEEWKGLIGRLDRREPATTVTYSPRTFGAKDVAALIEQTVPEVSAPGGGDPGGVWKLVVDELTGSLIVTATPEQHGRIESLLARLESLPEAARRPVRSFPIRNRNVNEIASVVRTLLDAGILQAGGFEPGLEADRPAELRVYTPPGTAPLLPQPEPPALTSSPPTLPGVPPALSLAVDEGTSTLIATGEARMLDQLAALIERLDVRQPQVMIEVLLVSLTDAQSLDLGVELEQLAVSGSTLYRLSSLFGLSTRAGGSRAVGDSAGFTGAVLDPGDFAVVVRALETINKGRSLSMPKVLASNNQPATLNSVLQIPYSVINASDTVATTSFGGALPAGTQVTVRPQIARGDHLLLEYSVALSSFAGSSATPGLPPPRQENNVQSVVTIPDGHTVAVGGLELITDDRGESRVPLIGRVPVLGELFKSRSSDASRTRFFVFIRPTILREERFADLKHLSARDVEAARVDDGWPVLEPRIMR